MKKAEEDLERALRNWARWVVSGGSTLCSGFPLAELASHGTRSEAPIPIMNGEAVELDIIIGSADLVPVRYAEVLRVHYVWEFEPPAAARRCRCCIKTYYNRLEKAWDLVHSGRQARHRAAAAVAESYRAAVEASRLARSMC